MLYKVPHSTHDLDTHNSSTPRGAVTTILLLRAESFLDSPLPNRRRAHTTKPQVNRLTDQVRTSGAAAKTRISSLVVTQNLGTGDSEICVRAPPLGTYLVDDTCPVLFTYLIFLRHALTSPAGILLMRWIVRWTFVRVLASNVSNCAMQCPKRTMPPG